MKIGCFVYISGPMTASDGRTIEQNTADGVAIYLELLKRGIPAFSPHLSGAFPSAWTAMSHQDWIDYDFRVIDRCTHMLMMTRWKKSKGACMEFEYALNCRVPVVFSIEELERALSRKPHQEDQMNDEQESKSADETTDVTTTQTEKAGESTTTDQADGHGTTEPEQAEAKEGVAV